MRGWVTYQGLKIPAIQETLDPNLVQLQTELLGLFTRYVYAMTGKQVNEREFENASRSTPTVQGTPQNNLATLKGFRSNVQQQLDAILKGQGWTFSGEGQSGGVQPTQADNDYISSLGL